MKNDNPSGKNPTMAATSQRLLAVAMLVVFAFLIWLAWDGRYDVLMNTIGEHLRRMYDTVASALRR